MADLSDVMSALVTLIDGVMFPNGDGSASIIGSCIRIFPGWPNPQQLAADLAAGTCEISVYPRPEERNTTRYPQQFQEQSRNTALLTLAVVNQTVTVAGTIPAAGNQHNLVVFVNGVPYVYAVQPSDTLTTIAAALAALIVVNVVGTTSSVGVIALPSSARIGVVRVGVTGTALKEIRRQERLFQIGIWADTPAHRDAIAKALDAALAALPFFALVDGSAARLIYKSSPMSDMFEKTGLYRRDLFYIVEYPTTQSEVETQVTQEQFNVSGGALPPTFTEYQ